MNGVPPRVYCAFNAVGEASPARSDIRYFNLLKAWNARHPGGPAFVDSHAVRYRHAALERRARLQAELESRLAASDVLLAVLTARSVLPGSWLPWELRCGVERFGLPVLCVYPGGVPEGGCPGGFLPEEVARWLCGPRASHLPFRLREVFAALARHRARGEDNFLLHPAPAALSQI